MATRRQEKVARLVKEAVSDAIANHLNDPRIEGFVSVTRVDVSADLRSADVYLSIFGSDPVSQKKAKPQSGGDDVVQKRTFLALMHAKNRIQALLAGRVQSKFCPVLRFHRDEKFKETLQTIRLIEKAIGELEEKDSTGQG